MSGVSPSVVVACEDHQLLDEVVRSLEELPHWRVVASAGSLSELIARCEPSAVQVVLCDGGIARAWADRGGPLGVDVVVVFERSVHPETLLASIEIQAKGFVAWPKERHRFPEIVERSLVGSARVRAPAGKFIGLWSPKGGAGTSTLAAHLSVALAPHGSTMLVDLDLENADQTAIFAAEDHKKTSADLLRVLDEMSATMIESVSYRHPSGLGVVLSPGALGSGDSIKPNDVIRLASSLCDNCQYLVADLAAANIELVHSAFEVASRFYFIVTPDLLCLKRARDAVKVIRASGARLDGAAVIVNQYVRHDVSFPQIEALTGLKVAASVRPDLGISRAAGKGEPAGAGARLLAPIVSQITGERPPKARSKLVRR